MHGMSATARGPMRQQPYSKNCDVKGYTGTVPNSSSGPGIVDFRRIRVSQTGPKVIQLTLASGLPTILPRFQNPVVLLVCLRAWESSLPNCCFPPKKALLLSAALLCLSSIGRAQSYAADTLLNRPQIVIGASAGSTSIIAVSAAETSWSGSIPVGSALKATT